ncbi:shematrin-like protein 1 [Apis florea]|uniref:shematrin-like protein 1 n=1 Tax=Apis florea TaxID=7463 RepID=UPI0006292586|nr:shematrin-like protein 1 [Apis florea]
MNFLSLLFLTILALGVATTVPPTSISEKSIDVAQKIIVDNQAQPNPQDEIGEKKVTKRSYGWSPWNYYSYGWPWYAIGWYPGWPYYGHGYGGYGYGAYGHGYGGYGGYIGYRGYGGWYKGW